MQLLRNEKGLTLIEVLVSIVILSFVLMTTMSFFPQMGLLNNQNTLKTQGINTAKEVLLTWENDNRLDAFFTTPNSSVIPEYKSLQGDDYYFESTQGNFFVKIYIKKTASQTSSIFNAHLIVVKLYRNVNSDIVVSESYGYVKVRG